jgi:hypothetical protein
MLSLGLGLHLPILVLPRDDFGGADLPARPLLPRAGLSNARRPIHCDTVQVAGGYSTTNCY